jgi:WD40 repeat protein
MTAVIDPPRVSGPYKGLTYFTEDDAAFFFGRESERALIVGDLKANRLTLVYGPSGAGKSSLLRAGVAASLRQAARRERERFGTAGFVPVVFSDWRDDPLQGLAECVSAAVQEFAVKGLPPGVAEPASAPLGLVEIIEAGFALAQAPLLVILDQFEEYFLYHGSDSGPLAFSEQFVRAVTEPGLPGGFLLATRDDALAQLDVWRGRIPKLWSSYRRVSPLSKRAARQAILGPLEEYNREIPSDERVMVAPELVDAVIEQVAAGEVKLDTVGAGTLDGAGTDAVEAPYLQLVMMRLWQESQVQGSRELRLSTLESLGGARKIVRSHLDTMLSTLPEEEQDVAADVFHQLVTPSGTKIAHGVADLAEYTSHSGEKVAAVLERLAGGDTRIVRPVQGPAGTDAPPRYEIFHDVLAPAVLDWRGRHQRETDRRDKEAAERRKEAAERRASVQRRRALVATAAAVLAIAALVVFVVRNAVLEQDANRSRVLAADAVANLTGDPPLSALLAMSAWQKSHTLQAAAALRQAYPGIEEERTMSIGHSVSAVAFSPDGQQVAAATGDDGVVEIWGPGHWKSPLSRRTDFSSVWGLAWSPDGSGLAAVGQVRKGWGQKPWPAVEIMPWPSRGAVKVLPVPDAADDQPVGNAVAWQGPYLVTADSNGYLCAYKGTAPRCARVNYGLDSVSLDRAGTMAAVSGDYGGGSSSSQVYSVPALRPVMGRGLLGIGSITDAALSPSGGELVTTSEEGLATLIGLSQASCKAFGRGMPPCVIDGFSNPAGAESATFSADGRLLATTMDSGQTEVWAVGPGDFHKGVQVAQLNCDCGVVYAAEFDPKSPHKLVTASEDGVVRVWDTAPREQMASYQVSGSFPFAGITDGIGQLSFLPRLDDVVAFVAGNTSFVKNPDGVAVVDLRTHKVTTVPEAPYAQVKSVGVSYPSRGGATLVWVECAGSRACGQGAWRLVGWHLRNSGGRPQVTAAHLRTPSRWPAVPKGTVPEEVEISPDGRWLAVYFWNHNVIDVVDLTTGRATALPGTASHNYYVNSIAFDPVGNRVLVAYNDATAWEWDLPGRAAPAKLVRKFADPDKEAVVWDAQWSPDGSHVALADNFGNVSIFSTANDQAPTVLNAGTGQVNSAVFSPGSKEVVTSGEDGSVRIWDIATRTQLAAYAPTEKPYTQAVNAAVFGEAADKPVVVAGGNDGIVRVWSIEGATPNMAELERLARARLGGRSYTRAERAEYLAR